MKISVVITTYNRFELAKRAIKSVIRQTNQPAEIIVIEDASETGIEDWINSNHSPVRYFRNEKNVGLAASRNRGIRFSRFEWIAYLDDDDIWLPRRLEEQVKCYKCLGENERKKLACIQVGNITINKITGITSIKLPGNDGDLRESIKLHGAHTPSSGFLFNKKALISVNGFDENLVSGIDHDIWMKLAVSGYKSKAVKKPLVRVIEDTQASMMSNTGKRILGIQQYLDKWSPTYRDWFGKKEGDKYAREYFASVIARLAGEKIAMGKTDDFFRSLRAIKDRIGFSMVIWVGTALKILKIVIIFRYPRIYTTIKGKNNRNSIPDV